MSGKTNALAFGDSAKFITDSVGVRGTVVLAIFEDGKIGITTDGVNSVDAQNMLATGIYMNMAEVVRREEARN